MAWMASMLARTSCAFSSKPRAASKGFMQRTSPPAQARKDISFTGVKKHGCSLSLATTRANAAAYRRKRAGKEVAKTSRSSGHPKCKRSQMTETRWRSAARSTGKKEEKS